MFQQFTAQGRVITYREHTARKTQVITYVLEHKIQQDGFYLRNDYLCLDPSNGMFITIDDALAFIPLDNIIGMKLPNEIVYP